MTTYFSADFHFGHEKVIGYSKRPFTSAKEMDDEMIRRWRVLVKPSDDVYILGDFAFADPRPYAAQLPGRKHLILGNHDDRWKSKLYECGFIWVKDVFGIFVEDVPIWLSHYAHLAWPKSHFGVWHVHGHSHGGIPATHNRCDVGVDCWDFAPVSFEKLKRKLTLPKPREPRAPRE
jgi:calcineurin-like phosphoesterase family protein